MYRAIDKQTGKEVFGWLCNIGDNITCILPDCTWIAITPNGQHIKREQFQEVHPESVAMATGIKDKHDKPIYGSFLLDGKRTSGGDSFRGNESGTIYNVEYEGGGFGLFFNAKGIGRMKHCGLGYGLNNLDLEIIGPQWESAQSVKNTEK